MFSSHSTSAIIALWKLMPWYKIKCCFYGQWRAGETITNNLCCLRAKGTRISAMIGEGNQFFFYCLGKNVCLLSFCFCDIKQLRMQPVQTGLTIPRLQGFIHRYNILAIELMYLLWFSSFFFLGMKSCSEVHQ